MKHSAFNPDGEHCHDMMPGVQEHDHALHTYITKHAKGGHGRGFYGKGGKGGKGNKAPQGGGEGMGSNMKGKGKKAKMDSDGDYD